VHDGPTAREHQRLAKLERTLRRGRWGLVWRCLCAGAPGGVFFAVAMRLVAPCFGCQPLTPPSGNEAHPTLEWALSSMSAHLGRFGAFAALSAGAFGLGFAGFGFRVHAAACPQHEALAARPSRSARGPQDR
jgi:hypothetical protein